MQLQSISHSQNGRSFRSSSSSSITPLYELSLLTSDQDGRIKEKRLFYFSSGLETIERTNSRPLPAVSNRELFPAPLPFPSVAKEIVLLTQHRFLLGVEAHHSYSLLQREFAQLGYRFQRQVLDIERPLQWLMPRLTGRIPHRPASCDQTALWVYEWWQLLQWKFASRPQWPEGPGQLKHLSESLLPPQLTWEDILQLPQDVGVYFFHDRNGRVLYVGKSRNIRKRILQHLQQAKKSKKVREMFAATFYLSYKLTGTELLALIQEVEDIQKHSPFYNRALKRSRSSSHLYSFEHPLGYLCLELSSATEPALEKSSLPAGRTLRNTFLNLKEGQEFLRQRMVQFHLCQNFCFLRDDSCRSARNLLKGDSRACFSFQLHCCRGACQKLERPEDYNKRVRQLLRTLRLPYRDCLILGRGRKKTESSLVLIESGAYRGYGFLNQSRQVVLRLATGGDRAWMKCIELKKGNRQQHRIIRAYLKSHHHDHIIPLKS